MPDELIGWFAIPNALIDNGHIARIGGALTVYLAIRRMVAGHESREMKDDDLMAATRLSRRSVEYARRALVSTEDPYIAVSGGRGRGVKTSYQLVDETLKKSGNKLRVLAQGVDKSGQKKPQDIAGIIKPAKTRISPHTPLSKEQRPRGARANTNPYDALMNTLTEFQIPQTAKATGLDADLLTVWVRAVVSQCHDEARLRSYFNTGNFQQFFLALRGKDAGIVAATLAEQADAITNRHVVFSQPFARAAKTITEGGPVAREEQGEMIAL